MWPLLLGIDPKTISKAPASEALMDHSEYKQVITDVQRSLARFPPGIPKDQRFALQGELTVLILQILNKHKDLYYYQVGVHNDKELVSNEYTL